MAYNQAQIVDSFQEGDGRVHVNVRYTGNAQEPPVVIPLYINQSTVPSADDLRAPALNQIGILNTNRGTLASLTPGAIIDTTTPIPPPTIPRTRSYMAASLPFTPGATPQDVFTLTGSASKVITVVRVGFCTIQTTAGMNAWFLLKRSTANSGGTSAAVTRVPIDGGTPSATVLQYTANPTAGNLVGQLWTGRAASPAPATAGIGDSEKVIDFQGRAFAPVTLTGTGEVLALNFNGVALPTGLSVTAHVWWTEL